MKQIICLSHSPWSTRPTRTQQLLTRLDNVQILYFEPPSHTQRRSQNGLRVRSNVFVYTLPPFLWSNLDQTLVRRQNQNRITRYIEKIMAKHHFKEPVLWCTTPENVFMVDQLAYRCLVYDCHREWDHFPLDWESDLTMAADVVFAASDGLQKRLAPCSDNIALLPNGVTPRMFLRDDLTPPATVASLPAPIFSRVGDLTSDLNLEPLIYAAQSRPQWTFLLLGRVGQAAAQALKPISNIVMAGPVPTVELPDYLSGCQVLFDLIRARRRGSDVVPSRIYEYLATGKPIVTMIEPEQTEPFPELIYTAYDNNGFVRRCQIALSEQNLELQSQRLNCARLSSWSNRADEILRILGDTGLF